MQYYPAYLDLRGHPCVVIGGGEIAARKVAGLLDAGARVTVVSPELVTELAALADTHEIAHHRRAYRRGDLAGTWLAYAATGDETVHAEIAAEAAEARVFLNVVDRPALCSFIVPAIVARGAVAIAVSTGGRSPALAKRLARELEGAIGPEWGVAAELLGKLRARLAGNEAAARARVFAALADTALVAAIRDGDAARVDALLVEHAGPAATLAALGVRLPAGAEPSSMDLVLPEIALVAYLGAAVGLALHLVTLRSGARVVGTVALATAFLAHGGSILARSVAGGYPAFTTEYEALSFFAWLTVGVYVAVQARYHLPALGAVVAPLAFTVTLASFAFYTGVRELPPNLRSAWLPVHVTAAFLGNAVLALAFCVSLVYLFHERQLKEKRIGAFTRRLPSLEALDQLNYRALAWGFPLLTLGIVTGALFAKHTWGDFWSWEEREVFSLITWLLYAGLLEARMVVGWRGRRAATVTIVGFAVLLVSFVFGHMIFPGKHGGSFD